MGFMEERFQNKWKKTALLNFSLGFSLNLTQGNVISFYSPCCEKYINIYCLIVYQNMTTVFPQLLMARQSINHLNHIGNFPYFIIIVCMFVEFS